MYLLIQMLQFIFVVKKRVKNILIYRSCDRGEWILNTISYRRRIIPAGGYNNIVYIIFGQNITKDKFEPMHIVLLSCLIEELKTNGYRIILSIKNNDFKKFVIEDIKVKKYWGGKNIVHIPSPAPSRFNLWRIMEEYKDAYAINVCEYFKRINVSKDLSGFQTTLNELYYNVFDHAEAKGNAFSYISFEKNSISIAVGDFGKGIARTIREAHPEYKSDDIALENAIKRGVTSRSKSHNAGLGLYNIVSMLGKQDYLRIISNKSLGVFIGNTKRFFNLEGQFDGTLIYLKMSIESFPEEEIIDSFSF